MSKALTPVQAVKNDLARMKDQFRAALPSHIPVDKFVRTVQTAVATSPQLVASNKQSLFAASMKAAQDGLLPDGREAAIVTFKNKQGEQIAQYMPMVSGILKKVRNSGELASITSQIVYEKDDFEFYVDEDGEHIKHKPNMFGERGKEIGAYALAKTKDGAVYIEVMTMDQIAAVKNVSRGKNGPWSGPFASEMIRKTVIKRLSKRLPMSTDLEFTMKADDDLYDLDQQPEEKEINSGEDKTAPQRLSKLMSDEAAEEVRDVYEEPPAPPQQEERKVKNYAPGAEELSDDEVPI